MEKYNSFKELKEHDYSKPAKPVLLKTTEKEVKAFVDLLRKSVVKKVGPQKTS